MVALSSEALFRANEIEPDPAIVPLIENGWNSLFTSSFDSVSGCFQYTDRVHATGGTELACDLNNLIAPQLFRLYQATGQDLWRQRADAVFAGGVRGSYFAGPKQFNQNYWLAIDFVKRRTGG
jgi:hypothetical protein